MRLDLDSACKLAPIMAPIGDQSSSPEKVLCTVQYKRILNETKGQEDNNDLLKLN
jgi:hypothetical protein